MAVALGCRPEAVRWEMPLVEVYRCRHAQLWLDGHRTRRAGRTTGQARSKRRERFDTLAAKYARRD